MDKANQPSGSQSWNTYWEGATGVGAYTDGGVSHPAVTQFWSGFFGSGPLKAQTPMLDIATGNGAILDIAVSRHGIPADNICCVDISPAAIAGVASRFPGIRAEVADAAHLPFEPGRFGLVTSQFGIEYAGRDAIFAACRQVADGGTLALLMHCTGSSIHDESRANLAAVSRLQETQFIPLAADFFDKGFAAVRGADRAPYDAAGATLAVAVQAVEGILRDFGPRVAGDTILRLYEDVAKIHGALPRYDADETRQWLQIMDQEIQSYSTRMRTMIDAAVDEVTFNELVTHLRKQRFAITRAELLLTEESSQAVAWVLVATRQSGGN